MRKTWLRFLLLVAATLAFASDPAPAADDSDALATCAASTKEEPEEKEEGEDGEEEEKIKFSAAPEAVQKTLKREAGGAEVKEVVEETEEGKTSYEAKVKIDGHEYVIVVAADGTLLEKELEDEDKEEPIKLSEVPAAAQKTLQREAAGAKIEKVDKLQREGRTLYETDVKIDGKNYEIIVTAEGLLLSKELDEGDEGEEEDEDAKEAKGKQPAIPEAVLKTFKSNFPQAKIHKTESEVEDGVTVYDIEFRERDVEKETDITADGVLLEFTIIIDAKFVPAPAMKAIEKAAAAATLERIEYVEITYETKDGKAIKLPKPITRYAVDLKKGDKNAEVVVNPDGTVVEKPKW